MVQVGHPPFKTQIKAVVAFVKTLYGLPSALPGVAALSDAQLDFLGISSAIKPYVYILVLASMAYVYLSEVSRYSRVSPESEDFRRMRRRGAVHFALFVAAASVYWIGIKAFEEMIPDAVWLRQSILVGFAVLVATSIMELTRALIIQGLRIYIANAGSFAASTNT